MLAVEPFAAFEVYVVAAAIAVARMSGVILIMPVFTRIGLTGILRSAVALAFALPLVPLTAELAQTQDLSFGYLAAILLKEFFIGAIIGLVLGIPIWAAETAGEILDLQRGVTFAELADPNFTTQNNATGILFSLTIIAIFFASGGLTIMLQTIYDSYSLWPVANFLPVFGEGSGIVFLGLLDNMLGLGFMLVAPIILAMLLSDLSLAIVARAAPHMNVFVLSLTVKNFVFSLLLVLYGVFMFSYMREDLSWFATGLDRLQKIIPSAGP